MSENNKHYILPKGKYVVDNFGTVMNVSKDITFPDKKTAFAFLEVQEHDKGRIKINKDYVLSMLKEGEGLKDFVAQEISIKQNNKNLLSLPPGTYGKGTAKEFKVDKKLHFINKSDVARIVDKNSYSDKEYKEVIKAIASSLIKEKSVAIPNTDYTKYENSKVKEVVKSAVKEVVSKEAKKPKIKTDEQSRKSVPKEMLDLFSMVKQEIEKNSKDNVSSENNNTSNDFVKKYKASSNKHKASLRGYNFDKKVSDAGQTVQIVDDIKNVVKESKEVEKKQIVEAEKELKNVEKLKKEVVKTSDSKAQSKLDKIEEKIIDSVKEIKNVSSENNKKARKPRNIYNVLNAGTYEVHDVSLSVKKNMMFDSEENLVEFLGLGQSFFSKAKSNYPNMFSEVTNKKNLKELDKKNIKVSLIEPKIMRERAREVAKKAAEEFKNKQNQEKEALDNTVKTVDEVKDDNVGKAKVFASNDMHKEVKPSTSGENSYKIIGKEKTKYLLQKGEYKFQGYKLNVSKDLYFDTQKDLGYYIEQKFGKSHNIEKVTKNSLAIFFKEKIKGFGNSTLLDYENNISLSSDESKTKNNKSKSTSSANPIIKKLKSSEVQLPSQKEITKQIKKEDKNNKYKEQKKLDQMTLFEASNDSVEDLKKIEKQVVSSTKEIDDVVNKGSAEYVKTLEEYVKEVESSKNKVKKQKHPDDIKEITDSTSIINSEKNIDDTSKKVRIKPNNENIKRKAELGDGINYNKETGEIIHDSNKIYQIEAERKLLKDILEIEEKIFELNKKATLEKKQYVDIITDEKSTEEEKLNAMSKMKGIDREYQGKIELLNVAKNAKKDEVNVSNKIVRNTIIEKLKNKNLSEEKIDTIMDYIYNPHKIEGLRYTARKGINRQQSYGGGSGGSGGNGGGRAFMGSDGEMIYGLSGNGDNNSMGDAISNAMTTVGRMRTLMSHVEMFAAYVKDLSRIEEAIFDLGVVGQKSIPEIRQMRDSFLNMATTSRYSVTQLSQAAADIVRVGYDYESSMQILKSGETLATASFEGNLRDSTGTLIKAMTAFQLSANSAAHAANSFHNIVNATPLDLKTFDDSLRQTAAAFGSIVTFSSKSGEELEEYKKQVLDTTAVLTGLQSMLGRTGSQAGR